MTKTTKKVFRKIAILVTLALLITSITGITNVNKAQAAVTGSGIIYDGNGEVTKMLQNGKSAKVTLDGSVIDINVGGEKYGYYSTICVGTCVISDDDLLHIFWHTGDYYVYDLYESGRFILAGYTGVKGYQINYYAVSSTEDSKIVKGTSAANASFHSCIIDSKYFYMYGQTGKKLLMTRSEFDKIVDGNDPEEPSQSPNTSAVPTVAPTAVPSAVPTAAPSETPTVVPSAVPTVSPSSNNCGCKDGKKCDCPAGQCKCDNCNCNSNSNCKPNGDNKSDINVPGNNNQISVNQNISSINTVTNVIGDNNNVGVDVNDGTAKKNDSNSSVKKSTYHVRRHGKYVSLTRTINGKTGVLCKVWFNKKNGTVKFNKMTFKGIKYVGYTAGSRQIILRTKKGVVKIVPRGKGKVGSEYLVKTLKGRWTENVENTHGLCQRVTNGSKKLVMGVKNAQPQKINNKK